MVSLWFDEKIKKDRKFDLVVGVADPAGKVLKEFKQECTIPAGNRRLRATTKIQGFGFTDGGKYLITLKYRENKMSYKMASEIPIDVSLTKMV